MNALHHLQLQSAALENIFCYREANIVFESGVSVFAGANGSGKSSLLEAIFFGLFGSATRTVTGRDLSEVLRDGERRGAVEVVFQLGEHAYKACLVLRRSGEKVSADGAKCVLTQDDEVIATQVKGVTEGVQALLHMDGEDFASCLYVRQGEVDRLINANSKDRQSTLDRLLRLTKIDEYEQRIKRAITALNRRKSIFNDRIDNFKKEISALETLDLPAQADRFERDLAQLESQRQDILRQISQREEEIVKLDQSIAQFQQTFQELKRLQERYQKLKSGLEQNQADEGALRQNVRQLQSDLNAAKRSWNALREAPFWETLELTPETPLDPQIERLETQVETLQEQLQAKRESLASLRAERQGKEAFSRQIHTDFEKKTAELERNQTKFQALEETLRQHVTALRFDEGEPLKTLDLESGYTQKNAELEKQRQALIDLGEQRARTDSTLENLRKNLEQTQALLKSGKCPTCQQPVSAEHIATQTRPLEGKIAQTQQQLEKLNEQIEMQKAETHQLEDELARCKEAMTCFKEWQDFDQKTAPVQEDYDRLNRQKEEANAALEQLRGQEDELIEQGSIIRQRHDLLKGHVDDLKRAQQFKMQLTQLREKLDLERQRQKDLARLSDARRGEMQTLSERFETLKTQLGALDVEQLESQRAIHRESLQQQKKQLSEHQQERDGIQNQLGKVQDQLQRLKTMKTKLQEQQEQSQQLDHVDAEVQRLQTLYADIKLTQRQKNLNALNSIFNHFFRLMEPGIAYDGVRLNEQFDIEIIRTDDSRMSPSLMSGGERALINLALRAAIHQLISEAGGVLLPLFFDEPTVFLDENHVSRLERLFEDLGQRVGQVIVVSHEDSLVESADHQYHVSKDADNIGQVEKVF